MLVAIATLSLLFIGTGTAGSQEPHFDTSLISVYRAISRGEIKKALLFYEAQAHGFEDLAKSTERPESYWEALARAYREASNSAHYLGNFQKAIVYGERALALAEKLDDPQLKLMTLSSLHQAFQSTRNFTKASEFTERGMQIAQRLPPNSTNRLWWDGVYYAKRAQHFRRQGEYEKAVKDYQDALNFKKEYLKRVATGGGRLEQRREHARISIALAYWNLGITYLSMGDLDGALESYKIGLAQAEPWSLEFPQTGLSIGIGDVLYRRNDLSGAVDYFQKALRLARRQQWPELISNAARRIGDLLRHTGKTSAAITFYQQAIQEIESVRSLLASQQNRQSYFGGGGLRAYQGMIEALWQTEARDQAFDYAERVRSRSFLDMLGTKVQLTRSKDLPAGDPDRLAEASHPEDSEEAYRSLLDEVRKTDPEQMSLMTVEPLALKEVQALLEPGQTVLEYLVTPRKTYLWVIERNQAHGVMIPLTQKAIAAKVQELRTVISELRPLRDYQKLAADLYKQLVAPAGRLLKGKELIIVPHDALHYLPFQALYSPQGKYLVEDHSVTYLSSASLLQFVKAKRKVIGQKVLAFGNPSFDSSKADLPMSELEAHEIRKIYPESTIFARSEASEAKIKSVGRNYDVLHFATHAELNRDDPLSSAVLLAKGEKEDGRLEVKEIFRMDLNASLVVLSGCETGLGQLSSGDELVGLTRAFIYAGTPSVVASLWKVDDASTAHLMSSFYSNLRSKTKVESLRQAQLDMIRGKVTDPLLAQRGVGGIGKLGQTGAARSSSRASISTSHPYFWAPFILIGDGK
jgi:CHAT domain-containing protein/lipopolysaccharide biosynthesis regulator YciM